MKTRLVRVRRRPRALWWAVLLLLASMALYVYVSLPQLRKMQAGGTQQMPAVSGGERVTREIEFDALCTHLISFGEYDSAPSAQIEAARYVSRGAAGYVLAGEVRQVIAAGYEDKKEAQEVCALLEAGEGINAGVVSLSASGFSMRITAGERQIEAFVQAQQTVRSAALAMGQLSFSLDRGEATALQAGNVIQTHYEKLCSAFSALEAQCAQEKNEVFEELLSLMRDMKAQMEKMQQETAAMALSSRLKYFYIDARVRQIEWMNDISA